MKMKKNKLAMSLALSWLSFAFPAAAATFYVNINTTGNCGLADGSAAKPFCAIQKGVTAATSGDTVQVAAGTYNEDVSIANKALKILGTDPATTTIVGFSIPFYMTGFNAPAKLVEIANFTITGTADYGVDFDSGNLTGWVHNCILLTNKIGIAAQNGANARASNNVIMGSSLYGAYTNSNGTLTLYSNILMNNITGAYATSGVRGTGFCIDSSRINSSYNRYFGNTQNRATYRCYEPGGGSISSIGDADNSDPKLVDPSNGDYHLQPGSPCVDAGNPGKVDLDPDGSRNDQGVYGGPRSAAFWPKSAGRPVVTNLSSSPHDVALGGTFTIKGVGKAQ